MQHRSSKGNCNGEKETATEKKKLQRSKRGRSGIMAILVWGYAIVLGLCFLLWIKESFRYFWPVYLGVALLFLTGNFALGLGAFLLGYIIKCIIWVINTQTVTADVRPEKQETPLDSEQVYEQGVNGEVCPICGSYNNDSVICFDCGSFFD